MQVRLFDVDFESIQTTSEPPIGDFIVEIVDDEVWRVNKFDNDGTEVRTHTLTAQVKVVESVGESDNANGRVITAYIQLNDHLADDEKRGFVYKRGLGDIKLYVRAVGEESMEGVRPTILNGSGDDPLEGIVERGHVGMQVPLRITKRTWEQASRATGEMETRTQFRYQFKSFN